MRNYQIKICRPGEAAALTWMSPHPSTYDALCRARSLERDGTWLEVWRDGECVHREQVSQNIAASAHRPLEMRPE